MAAAKGAAVPGLGNSVAMRQAILRTLGLSPGRLTGFKGNAQFDQNINDLYLKGLQDTAAFDAQEGTIGRNYAQNAADARIKNERNRQNMLESATGRGMAFSSGFVDDTNKAETDYNTYLSNLQRAKEANITDLGRQREVSDAAITRGVNTAQRSYGDELKDFISQQAIGSWVAETNAQQQRAAQRQQAAALRAMSAAQRPVAPRVPRPPVTTGTTPQLDLNQLSTENLTKPRRPRATAPKTPNYNNFIPFG